MTDIEQVLNDLFENSVDAYNVVANVNGLPYAVFSVGSTPRSTKEGIYRYDHNVDISIVAGSFDKCKSITGEVVKKLLDLRGDDLTVTNLTESGEGDSDIYVNKIECLIIEFV